MPQRWPKCTESRRNPAPSRLVPRGTGFIKLRDGAQVSESAVGDALASNEWRFAFDCTFVVQNPWGVTSPTWLAQQAERTSAPLWAWIRRRLPPWCGLRATIATSDGSCSVPLLDIRFPFTQE